MCRTIQWTNNSSVPTPRWQADRLSTYYDSGALAGTVTLSGTDQRTAASVQVTSAAAGVPAGAGVPHSRADHINTSNMMRTTGIHT